MKIMFLIGMLMAGAVQAHEGVRQINIDNIGKVPYEFLFEETSVNGETMDQFMARIAPRLVAYSEETGFEACGVIATKGDAFGIRIGSNHSHVACANFRAMIPDGMEATPYTIHSHGKGAAKMNVADMRFRGIPETARSQRMFGTLYGQDRDKFSDQDLKGAAGYLATPNGLIHHNAKGVIRVISNI